LPFRGSSRRASFKQKLLDIAVLGAVAHGAEVTKLRLLDLQLPIYNGDCGLPAGARDFTSLLLRALGAGQYLGQPGDLQRQQNRVQTQDWSTSIIP
jgi:hypothetical protein